MRRLPFAVLTLGLIMAPSHSRAQTRVRPLATLPRSGVSVLVRDGDAAHTALRPLDALDTFRRALEKDPDDFESLWRASREAVDLGMLAADGNDRKRWYDQAIDYARRAKAADSTDARGAEWLAIALGRKALEEGPSSRVHMAVEIHDLALEALALDSLNAGAHHVLGEWNAQIRRLSGIERWIARKLMGGSVFDQARWKDAEYHLGRAIELDPNGLIHYLDLARVYVDLDRKEEARDLLRQVLERPAVEPVDPLNKQAAQDLLRKLGP